MARLRFPGRPGQRFGRNLVRLLPEEAQNCHKTFFNITATIHRNLKQFYELVGESDEDEEFEGFLDDEIRAAQHSDIASSPEKSAGIPSRGRITRTPRKSYKDLLKYGRGAFSKVKSDKKESEVEKAVSEVKYGSPERFVRRPVLRLKRLQNRDTHGISDVFRSNNQSLLYNSKEVESSSEVIGSGDDEDPLMLIGSGQPGDGKIARIIRLKGRKSVIRYVTPSENDYITMELIGRKRQYKKPFIPKKVSAPQLKVAAPSRKPDQTIAKQLLRKARKGRTAKNIFATLALAKEDNIPILFRKRQIKRTRQYDGMVSGQDFDFLRRKEDSSVKQKKLPKKKELTKVKELPRKRKYIKGKAAKKDLPSLKPELSKVTNKNPKKFSLPQISARSSRKIKPSKRFLDGSLLYSSANFPENLEHDVKPTIKQAAIKKGSVPQKDGSVKKTINLPVKRPLKLKEPRVKAEVIKKKKTPVTKAISKNLAKKNKLKLTGMAQRKQMQKKRKLKLKAKKASSSKSTKKKKSLKKSTKSDNVVTESVKTEESIDKEESAIEPTKQSESNKLEAKDELSKATAVLAAERKEIEDVSTNLLEDSDTPTSSDENILVDVERPATNTDTKDVLVKDEVLCQHLTMLADFSNEELLELQGIFSGEVPLTDLKCTVSKKKKKKKRHRIVANVGSNVSGKHETMKKKGRSEKKRRKKLCKKSPRTLQKPERFKDGNFLYHDEWSDVEDAGTIKKVAPRSETKNKDIPKKLLQKAKAVARRRLVLKAKESAAKAESVRNLTSKLQKKSPMEPRTLTPATTGTWPDAVSRQMAEAIEADRSPDRIAKNQVQKREKRAVAVPKPKSVRLLGRGPRIKHVCRRASVALGCPTAIFLELEEPSLSALPLDQRDQEMVVLDSDTSIDRTDTSSPSISSTTSSPCAVRTRPASKTGRNRKVRCKKCAGCTLENDCEKCGNCLDKTKYGGRNVRKQCCIHKKCSNPQLAASAKGITRPRVRAIQRLMDFNKPDNSNQTAKKSKAFVANKIIKKGLREVLSSRQENFENGSNTQLILKSQMQQMNAAAHRIMLDYKTDCNVLNAWKNGVAILSSEPMVPRTVCYLCGSKGQHDFLYCNICCEPFHDFCLDEEDQPLIGEIDKWCCRNCKFCHVCGCQNNLLQCNKCKNTYHAECLGPNYPTKPSKRRKIWICTKCVKCKSCGATTPGTGNATWCYDFSLCQDCGRLFDRGNYCPICNRCYEDDDYESKMMQCGSCDTWIHAKCEGLTDDLYNIMADLPENVPYLCPRCDPVRPAKWMTEIMEEMQAGFKNVITSLLNCKSASHLIKPKKNKSRKDCNRSFCGVSDVLRHEIPTRTSPRLHLEGSYSTPTRTSPRLAIVDGHSKSAPQTSSVKVGSPSSLCGTTSKSRLLDNQTLMELPLVAYGMQDDMMCDTQDVAMDNIQDVAMNAMQDVAIDLTKDVVVDECNMESAVSNQLLSESLAVSDFVLSGTLPENSLNSEYSANLIELRTNSNNERIEDVASVQMEILNLDGNTNVSIDVQDGSQLAISSESNQENASLTLSGSVGPTALSVSGEARSVDPMALSVSGESGSVDTTALSVSGEARSVDPTALSVCGESGSVDPMDLPVAGESGSIDPTVLSISEDSGSCNPLGLLTTEESGTVNPLGSETERIDVMLVDDSKTSISLDGLEKSLTMVMSSMEVDSTEGINVDKGSLSNLHVCFADKDPTDKSTNIDIVGCSNNMTLSVCQAASGSTKTTSLIENTRTLALSLPNRSNEVTSSGSLNSSAVTANSFGDTNIPNEGLQTAVEAIHKLSSTKANIKEVLPVAAGVGTSENLCLDLSSLSPSTCTTISAYSDEGNVQTSPINLQIVAEFLQGNVANATRTVNSTLITLPQTSAIPSNSVATKPISHFASSTNGPIIPLVNPNINIIPQDVSFIDLTQDLPDDISSLILQSDASLHEMAMDSVVVTLLSKPVKEKAERPSNFLMIKDNVDSMKYLSVSDFIDDCVAIMQESISSETLQTVGLKRSNQVVREQFQRVMEKMFPWCNVLNSNCWQKNQIYPDGMLPNAVLPPHSDHEYAQWQQRSLPAPKTPQPSPLKKVHPSAKKPVAEDSSELEDAFDFPPLDENVEDPRRCSFCGEYGDQQPDHAGRLLYSGQDEWIHINCGLWSAEVFEEIDGSLVNVHTAISRGRLLRCELCERPGATVGCNTRGCPANYHFMCGRKKNAFFLEDKKVFCWQHGHHADTELVEDGHFGVLRRVCVSLDNMKLNKNFAKGLQPSRVNAMIGSLTVEFLGRLGPLSNCKEALYPIGYRCCRVYWSTVDPGKRCVYTIRILEVTPETSPGLSSLIETNKTLIHNVHANMAGKELSTNVTIMDANLEMTNSSIGCPADLQTSDIIPLEIIEPPSDVSSNTLPENGSGSVTINANIDSENQWLDHMETQKQPEVKSLSDQALQVYQEATGNNVQFSMTVDEDFVFSLNDSTKLSNSYPMSRTDSWRKNTDNARCHSWSGGETELQASMSFNRANKDESLLVPEDHPVVLNRMVDALNRAAAGSQRKRKVDDAFNPINVLYKKSNTLKTNEIDVSDASIKEAENDINAGDAVFKSIPVSVTPESCVTKGDAVCKSIPVSVTPESCVNTGDEVCKSIPVSMTPESCVNIGDAVFKSIPVSVTPESCVNTNAVITETDVESSISVAVSLESHQPSEVTIIQNTADHAGEVRDPCIMDHLEETAQLKTPSKETAAIHLLGKSISEGDGKKNFEFEETRDQQLIPVNEYGDGHDNVTGKLSIKPSVGSNINHLLRDNSKNTTENEKMEKDTEPLVITCNGDGEITAEVTEREQEELQRKDEIDCGPHDCKTAIIETSDVNLKELDEREDLNTLSTEKHIEACHDDEEQLECTYCKKSYVKECFYLKHITSCKQRNVNLRDDGALEEISVVITQDEDVLLEDGDDGQLKRKHSTNNDEAMISPRSRKKYKLEAERLNFDEFVPEAKLDKLDIAKPGRKSYPMRNTSSRLIRIAAESEPMENDEELPSPPRIRRGLRVSLSPVDLTAVAKILDKDGGDHGNNPVPRKRGRPRKQPVSSETHAGNVLEDANGKRVTRSRHSENVTGDVEGSIATRRRLRHSSGVTEARDTKGVRNDLDDKVQSPPVKRKRGRPPLKKKDDHGSGTAVKSGESNQEMYATHNTTSIFEKTKENSETVETGIDTLQENKTEIQLLDKSRQSDTMSNANGQVNLANVSTTAASVIAQSPTVAIQSPPSETYRFVTSVRSSSDNSVAKVRYKPNIIRRRPSIVQDCGVQTMQRVYMYVSNEKGGSTFKEIRKPCNSETIPTSSLDCQPQQVSLNNCSLLNSESPKSVHHSSQVSTLPVIGTQIPPISGPPGFIQNMNIPVLVQPPPVVNAVTVMVKPLNQSASSPAMIPTVYVKDNTQILSPVRSPSGGHLHPSPVILPAQGSVSISPTVQIDQVQRNSKPSVIQISPTLPSSAPVLNYASLAQTVPLSTLMNTNPMSVVYSTSVQVPQQQHLVSTALINNQTIERHLLPNIKNTVSVTGLHDSMMSVETLPPVGQMQTGYSVILSSLAQKQNIISRNLPNLVRPSQTISVLESNEKSGYSYKRVHPQKLPIPLLPRVEPIKVAPYGSHRMNSILCPSYQLSAPQNLAPAPSSHSVATSSLNILQALVQRKIADRNTVTKTATNPPSLLPTTESLSSMMSDMNSDGADHLPLPVKCGLEKQTTAVHQPQEINTSNVMGSKSNMDTEAMASELATHDVQKENEIDDQDSTQPAGLVHKCPAPPIQNVAEEQEVTSPLLSRMAKELKESPVPPSKDEPHLVYEVTSDDGFSTQADTMEEAWKQVVDLVNERRNDARMKSLSFTGVHGLSMLGITNNAMVFLIEQLFGAPNCRKYCFRFHQYKREDDAEEEPPINPHGCARAECRKRTRFTHDMFDFLASKHRKPPPLLVVNDDDDSSYGSSRRPTSIDLPMAMRFRHLKDTAKEAVGVFRSDIHGRGLFCKRLIEPGEMIIEYSGTVIRSVLTDKREKYYESKGIGCYMFRIDDFDVIDATVHGNAARFINHSCEPNCYSRVINIDGKKHIVIFASRQINVGEELTYDYKFPIEDIKLPCNCGSRKCRKYLN